MDRLNTSTNATSFVAALSSGISKCASFGGKSVSLFANAVRYVGVEILLPSFAELASIGKDILDAAVNKPEPVQKRQVRRTHNKNMLNLNKVVDALSGLTDYTAHHILIRQPRKH